MCFEIYPETAECVVEAQGIEDDYFRIHCPDLISCYITPVRALRNFSRKLCYRCSRKLCYRCETGFELNLKKKCLKDFVEFELVRAEVSAEVSCGDEFDSRNLYCCLDSCFC